MQKRFLVISYDSDQPQWFYDTVMATSENDAAEWVCNLRPYVVGADAIELSELRTIVKNVSTRTPEELKEHWESVAKESGVGVPSVQS